MYKFIKLLFFVVITLPLKSQVYYSNYLDSTVEWYRYSFSWNQGASWNTYTTIYFDGDTFIQGKYYYRECWLSKEIAKLIFGPPDTNIYFSCPYFTREDSSKKILKYSKFDSSEFVFLDNQKISEIQINDSFPTPLPVSCKVDIIDTFYLGTKSLKSIRSNLNNLGILEGVGILDGNLCGMLFESTSHLVCFKKQNNLLQFTTQECDSMYPVPIRKQAFSHLSNIHFLKNKNTITQNEAIQFLVLPNPSSQSVTIQYKIPATVHYFLRINTFVGEVLKGCSLESSKTTLEIQTTEFKPGLYFCALVDEKGSVMQYRKLVVVR
ncbi:MAG: hypothetical protein A3G23_03940 [Bacteroidetes bacterium RIFCSPLOWO2_12_FULL_37_12]|nr:MAG: hypothetical protein A3G23_03940 [Bacteroidetes bacterium RIFCSPLOWO2_12_FULL_37_12]